MEEPLLDSAKNHSIKERLIFGSPHISSLYLSLFSDQIDPAATFNNSDSGDDENNDEIDSKDSHLSRSELDMCDDVYAYCHSPRYYQNADVNAIPFDDMLVEYRRKYNLLPSLTRLDLDERGSFIAPCSQDLSAATVLACSLDTSQREQSDNQFAAALMHSKECFHPSKYLRRARTAPTVTPITEKASGAFAFKTAQSLGSPISVVSQALIWLMLYLAVGVIMYILAGQEFSGSSTNGFFDALYFCIVTLSTIGYGDITPVTPLAKLFSCVFVLIGFGFVDMLLSAMVTYILQKQENVLLNTVAAGPHETARTYLVDVKKGRMRIRSKVVLAFGVVILCIGVGTFMMNYLEKLGWIDAFYLSCMSVTTVGYGDHAFKTLLGRVFASVWLLVSTLAVAQSFLYLAEARIDKRHRLIAKLVLEKEMTVGDLLAADLDNDGSVSKSDFVVYKLKQMGKIDERDILSICKQFNKLDVENSGKITLSCLLNVHKASAEMR